MNRTYKSIWNEALGAWVAASEVTRSHGKKASKIVAMGAIAGAGLVAPVAQAGTYQGTYCDFSWGNDTSGTITVKAGGSSIACATALGAAVEAGHYFSVKSGDTGIGSNYLNDGAKASDSMAIGPYATTTETAINAVALGRSASASAQGGIALGAGSSATTAGGITGYSPSGQAGTGGAWVSGAGAVSVGSDSVTRQITNLAAGTQDTDAVNVAQLKQASAGTYQSWKLSAQGANSSTVGSGATVNLGNADGNLLISKGAADTNVKFDLASTIKVGPIAGGAPVTVNGTTGTVTGLMNKTLTAADFATVGRAATEEQLKLVDAKTGELSNTPLTFTGDSGSTDRKLGETLKVAGDSNITTEATAGQVQVKLNPNVSVTSLKAGNTLINSDGLTITNGPSVTIAGINAGSKKVTNVQAGTADTDAVNVSQLAASAAAAKTSSVIAGNNTRVTSTVAGTNTEYQVHAKKTTVSGAGAVQVTAGAEVNDVTDYALDLTETTKADIQKGVDAKGIVDTKGLTFTADGSTTTGVKKLGETVAITGDDNITTTAGTAGVAVALNKQLDLGTAGSVTMGDTVVDAGGLTITNGPSVTIAGINAGSKKVTNVLAGTDGTDAVNLNQLKTAQADLTDKGFGLKAQDGVSVMKKLGEVVEVVGGGSTTGSYSANNVKTAVVEGKVQVQIAESPKFGAVTVNADGSGKITGLTAGEADTDAVNVSQLKEVEETAGKGWNLQANGGTSENVAPGETVNFADGQNIAVSRNGKTITVATKPEVAFDKVTINAGGPVLSSAGIAMVY